MKSPARRKLIVASAAVAVLVVVAYAATGWVRNELLRRMLSEGLGRAGMATTIGSFRSGLLSPVIEIENLRIQGPTNFPVRDCLEIRSLRLKYKRLATLELKSDFSELDLDLARIVMVRNREGRWNFEPIETLVNGGSPSLFNVPAKNAARPPKRRKDIATNTPVVASTAPIPAPATPARKQATNIDLMRLRIGVVEYYDYAGGDYPQVIKTAPEFDKCYTNLTDMAIVQKDLGDILMVSTLTDTLALDKETSRKVVDLSTNKMESTAIEKELNAKFDKLIKDL